MTSIHPDALLLKFAMSKNHQVVLQGHKGLARTKLGLDEDLMPTQQARKLNLWPLFKRPRQQASAPFGMQPNSLSMALRFARPPLSKGAGTRETYAWYYGTCIGVCK